MKHFFKRMVSMTIALAVCLSVVAAAAVATTTNPEGNSSYQIFGADWEEDDEGRS